MVLKLNKAEYLHKKSEQFDKLFMNSIFQNEFFPPFCLFKKDDSMTWFYKA